MKVEYMLKFVFCNCYCRLYKMCNYVIVVIIIGFCVYIVKKIVVIYSYIYIYLNK